MKLIADTHTHSLACDHAYSTITENCAAAKQKGIPILCSTEHTPQMPGGPTELYFWNLKALPRQYDGVTILRGAEVNVLDMAGSLDLKQTLLAQLEWVIASIHPPNYFPSSREVHTQTWITVAKNPLIHVIGHCGDGRYDFHYEEGVRAFKEYGKVVEINASSFIGRPNSPENCRAIALLCKQYEVPVVVSSDSHFAGNIGNFTDSLAMLAEIDFPEELVLNADYSRFTTFVNRINNTEIFPPSGIERMQNETAHRTV